jgi:hypothetical protein
VREFLKEIGETEHVPTNIPKETIDAVLGRYDTAGPETARFEVLTNKQGLAAQGTGGAPRNLRLLPDGSLHPVGAQSVRFTLEVVEGQAKSASLMMGGKALRAMRCNKPVALPPILEGYNSSPLLTVDQGGPSTRSNRNSYQLLLCANLTFDPKCARPR